MKGHSTRITVQPSRYSGFDPDRWWKTRTGVRIEIVELTCGESIEHHVDAEKHEAYVAASPYPIERHLDQP